MSCRLPSRIPWIADIDLPQCLHFMYSSLMTFKPIAIKKLNTLIERGFTITSIQIDFSVSESDGKFSTLTIKIAKDYETGSETGSIDEHGRVTWDDH